MKNPWIARRLVVEGRVQGVSYRDWAIETANGLGLHGWVRNRSDGSVELLLAGPTREVSAMVEACRRGSAFARVDRLVTKPAEIPTARGFTRLPDA